MITSSRSQGLIQFMGGTAAVGTACRPCRPLRVALFDESMEGLATALVSAGVLSADAARVALCEPDTDWVADMLEHGGFDGLLATDGRSWAAPGP